jgi:hypothetical protein
MFVRVHNRLWLFKMLDPPATHCCKTIQTRNAQRRRRNPARFNGLPNNC